MIVPYLYGILRFQKCPVTWILFGLNVLVMISTMSDLNRAQDSLDKAFDDEYYIAYQGHFYAEFISDNQAFYSPLLQTLSLKSLSGDEDKTKLLGNLALRSDKFLREGPSYPFKGDQVARGWWIEKFAELRKIQDGHPSFVLGLNSEHIGFKYWINYQFVHSGFSHFAFNMAFLFVFGCYLETLFGGLLVLITYLGSGVMGAASFLLINGATGAPLIGASAAVSGLMALVCLLHWRVPVRCFYWLFIPVKGYSGFVNVPAWIIFFLWLATDLAGYLGSVPEFGGIAHTAHLGGQLSGALIGGTLLAMGKLRVRLRRS